MSGANGDQIIASSMVLPKLTKAEKVACVAPQGTIVYDTTAKKISIKTEDANVVGSWELVTSTDDS